MEQQEYDQSSAGMQADDKNRKTLSNWIGDMVALETHIEEALDRQLNQVKDDPIAEEAVQQFHDMVKRHKDAIKQLQDDYGKTAGSPIKEVGSNLLGKAAGVIDMIRAEGNSKSIRDDYTSFNLAAIGYTMLYTTATALGDRRVADLSEQHLRGYAAAIQRINHIIPDIVVKELQKDDHMVQPGAADETRKVVDRVWRQSEQTNSFAGSMAG